MARRLRLPIWGLMAAVALAAVLAMAVKPHWPGWSARYRTWQANRLIEAQLGRTVALRHPSGVGLAALLEEVRRSTRSDRLPSGIPIYVDEVDLWAAGASLGSSVTIDETGAPLREALRSALGQYGLDYLVYDGILEVVDRDKVP